MTDRVPQLIADGGNQTRLWTQTVAFKVGTLSFVLNRLQEQIATRKVVRRAAQLAQR